MVASTEPMPLDENLTDVHYAQLFFVVGHTAIKMLTYVEQIESVMKQALQDSYKKGKKKRQSSGSGQEDDDGDDDLAQITGGKEAEVEQYCGMLQDVTEN